MNKPESLHIKRCYHILHVMNIGIIQYIQEQIKHNKQASCFSGEKLFLKSHLLKEYKGHSKSSKTHPERRAMAEHF